MAYNDETYSSPDVGSYSTTSSSTELDFVYLLPTGDIWAGEVHQMEDGSYMTGSSHTAASVFVIKVQSTPEYPNEGLVAKSGIFNEVFSKINTWAVSSEGKTATIATNITKLENKVQELNTLLTSSINKIAAFIQTVNIHSENAGNGQILDHNLDYMLDTHSMTDLKSRISDIRYEHSSSDPVYIFDGFVDTGLTNAGILNIDENSIRLDMVSRTGAPVIPAVDDILLDYDLAVGFNGKIVVEFSQATSITSLDLPTNANITGVTFDDDSENIITNWTNIDPISVKKINFHINLVAPGPFTSYISNDLQEDLLGNPQVDQVLMDPAVYQKTSLNIGKLKTHSVTYKTDKEFILGEYRVKSGSLRSLTISPIEELEGYTDLDSYFSYLVMIGGVEYPISPWTRNGNSPKIYYINVNLPDDIKAGLAANQGVGFIDTESPQIDFKLKVKLSRPDIQYISPKLKGITFNYSTSLDGGFNG